MLHHPNRIGTPRVAVGTRGDGEWQDLSSDEALTLLADRLAETRGSGRAQNVALVAGYCAGSMENVWRQFLQAYGSPNYVRDDYDDGGRTIVRLMHGIDRPPSYDLERSSLILSFGVPLFESWWSPLQAYVAFGGGEGGNGERPRCIQVDTRFSRTAAFSQEWVGVHPGTLSTLALGVAYVLIQNNLYDAQFVSTNLTGFEDTVDGAGELREGYRSLVLNNFRTGAVSAITGVPVERITELARAFAESPSPVAVYGSDVTREPNGLQAGMAIHSLNLLMGSIRRDGGVLLGRDAPLAPLATLELDDIARSGLASAPAVGSGPTSVAGDDADRFAEAVASGEVDVDTLLLHNGNPLASSTHPELWRAALDRIPFVVSFSPFLDETTRHADLVIPDLLPLERWQDAPAPSSYPHALWGIARPLVEPPEDATHTGDVVLALAERLGGSVARSLPYEDFPALLKQRAEGLFEARRGVLFTSEFDERHHRQMEERGWWLPEYEEYEAFWRALVDRGGWSQSFHDLADPGGLAQTQDGRIHLMPDELLEAMSANGVGGRIYDQVFDGGATPTEEFPYRLMPYRVSTLTPGTLSLERWMAETPGLFPEGHWYPWVEVNPATARALDLEEDAMVWVISERDRIRARVKFFHGTAPETVCVPYEIQHPDGELANPLHLLTESKDPLTGCAPWATSFVRLEPASGVEI